MITAAEQQFNATAKQMGAEAEAQRAADARFLRHRADIWSALEDALEYFEAREDVLDGDYGKPEANREMRLAMELRDAIAQAGLR